MLHPPSCNQDRSRAVDIHWPNASNGLTNANMLEAPSIWNGEVSRQHVMRSEPSRFQGRVSTNTDIASSNTGEVKLSLTYISDCPDFKAPNLESIFKIVEDRCLKSYKILQPDFSLMNIMKEICQCAVDLAAESGKDTQKKVRKVTPNGSGSPVLHTRMTTSSSGASMALVALESPRETVNSFESSQDNDMRENSAPEPSCHNISQSLAVIPLQGPLLDESDIAKGEERVRISLINEFTSERFPAYFHYIPQNAVYQNAYVNFSLARIGDEDCCLNCFGDCLNTPIPCACTRETGGEFVYTLDGLLKKEFLDECISMIRYPDKHHHVYCKDCPIEKSKNEHRPDACKGHLVRKFVKECWSKCGCSKYCGNRVVQRGIARNLQVISLFMVFYSAGGKGWGLRTLEELPRGAFVCEYVGEILTNIELYDRTIKETGGARHTYPVLLDADWGSEAGLRDEEALCLDATFYGNVGRFVNHRYQILDLYFHYFYVAAEYI
ncbi:Histone-lysine N-methyltransferase SUVR4 [Platanthera guangdongensis]|uniref:Histone-lysine N-methyltransferase SUVR4 n=1 Tax=Platanthera guangdongensis TaxID=2320717 RepID=A0ABR2LMQ3_9ASPA